MNTREGTWSIIKASVLQLVRNPTCWIGFFGLPLLMAVMLVSVMNQGLPTRIPAGIVDLDHSSMSRNITQQLNGMQLVELTKACESYTEAHHDMQKGEIFGYFLIPDNFERDLLSGRRPTISFYTNMAYYVPGSLLFKSFKTTAVYTKAGTALTVAEQAGINAADLGGMLVPVNVVTRPIGNPQLNYAIYLNNSFIPCVMQLMIMLMTVYSLGEEIKYGRSPRLLRRAGGSIVKAVGARLLPQTLIWMVIMLFTVSLLYGWAGYPMRGSWGWLLLSEFLFILAAQGLALLIFCAIPNLRLSLSACALFGILSFSIAAFSFPVQSMYGAIGIFSYLLPIRYNYLIYVDQALNGIPLYYSRIWYAAYFAFIIAPLPLLPRLKKAFANPVYVQ